MAYMLVERQYKSEIFTKKVGTHFTPNTLTTWNIKIKSIIHISSNTVVSNIVHLYWWKSDVWGGMVCVLMQWTVNTVDIGRNHLSKQKSSSFSVWDH